MPRLDGGRWRLPRRGLLARWAHLLVSLPGAAGLVRVGENEAMAEALTQDDGTPGPEEARLLARPGQPTETASPGLHPLGLDRVRDALLFVPTNYRADRSCGNKASHKNCYWSVQADT